MARTRPLVVLATAAALLPGCYFVKHAIPFDPSGMEYPLQHGGEVVQDQFVRTGGFITGLPSALARHVKDCWKNLTRDPAAHD
jgi:hypothetical protein